MDAPAIRKPAAQTVYLLTYSYGGHVTRQVMTQAQLDWFLLSVRLGLRAGTTVLTIEES